MPKLLKSLLACAVAAFVTCFLFMEWQDFSVNTYLEWARLVKLLLAPSWMIIGRLSLITFLLMMAVGLPLRALWLKPPRDGLVWHIVLALAITTVLIIVLLPLAALVGIAAVLELYPAALIAIVIFWLIRRPDKDVRMCALPPVPHAL